MTQLLVRLFIKDADNVTDTKVRGRYGILSGSVGVAVNVLLCLAKFIVGTVTGSIAITADAVNNLSDAGSSAVTVFGFKMASRPADDDHPYGHGRIEYITAMIVSFIILFMGGQLAIQSIDKIRNPESVSFSLVGAVIIGVSIFGKLWLALFNRKLGKKIDSPAMTAVVADSLSDIAATTVTLIALILSAFYPDLHIDGYLGILVALFVLKAGIGIFKDTLGSLIGEPPTKETVQELEDLVLSFDNVLGIHDVMLHNYGPENYFGTLHIEMPGSLDIMKGHDTADRIEETVREKMGIHLTVHYDPIAENDELRAKYYATVSGIIADYDPDFRVHDFRIVTGQTHTNIIFDLVVPRKYSKPNDEIGKEVSDLIHLADSTCFAVIKVEHSFV